MSTDNASSPSEAKDPGSTVRTLRAVLPSNNGRYNHPLQPPNPAGGLHVIPARTRVPILAVGHLPNGWTEFTTPEGDRYFWHDVRLIVTPLDLRRPEAERQVMEIYDYLFQVYGGVTELPACEVYINAASPHGDMEYYFIDPVAKQPFWVEDLNTHDLGLAPFGSFGYLKSALTPEYWTHVDYFPMHRPIDDHDEEELLAILRHGCIDGMTSPGSTSPYSAEECRQYLGVLEGCRVGGIRSGYRTASFARIWSAISRTRHINNYGLEGPRLDRLQGLAEYYQSQVQRSFLLSLLELLSFRISRKTFHRLTALWNGRVVYQRHWEVFWNDMRSDWSRVGGIAGVVFIGAMILLARGEGSLPVVAAASCSAAATLTATYLVQTHSTHHLGTGPEISYYIVRMESYLHGLRPLALAFAAPHALTIFAALFLIGGLMMKGLESLTDTLGPSTFILTATWCLPFFVILPILTRF